MTVRVGGGKKEVLAAGRRGPPNLPEGPSEGDRSPPLEVTLGPERGEVCTLGPESFFTMKNEKKRKGTFEH